MHLNIGVSTPSILFTVMSLLFVGYNNRLHCLAMLIREMTGKASDTNREKVFKQIKVSRKRMFIIKKIQLFGVISFIFSLFSILFLAFDVSYIGGMTFIMSILFMIITLSFAVYEILISTSAIEMEIEEHFNTIELGRTENTKLKRA